MGMDVYGEAPKNKKGEYFRNNCWWWRPLWNYVCDNCDDVLSDRDHSAGHYNDGHLIEAERAERIAKKLRALCESGKVLDFEREYKRYMDSIPDELCRLCNGTGVRPGGKEQFGGVLRSIGGIQDLVTFSCPSIPPSWQGFSGQGKR